MATLNRKVIKTYKKTNTKKAINTTSKIDWGKYYNNKMWYALRNSYIREHPLCECCYEKGIIKPAEEVHHITPFSQGANAEERWELLLDESNLQSLCHECHKEKHKDHLFGH